MISFFLDLMRRQGAVPDTGFSLPEARVGQSAYLVSYGDSIASGAYVGGDANTYGAQVAGMIAKTYDIEGYSSQTVEYLLANVNGNVLSKIPTFCIVEGGINDIHAGAVTADIISDKNGIISACINSGIIPVVLPLLSYFNYTQLKVDAIKEVNDAVLAFCNLNNVMHVDPRPVLCEDEPGYYAGNLLKLKDIYQADILHPNIAGHTVIADAIYAKLQEVY